MASQTLALGERDREKERMSLRHVWNDEQRRRLLAQLAATSRFFTAALPDEDAIDGLIMNLHLCLTLELSPAEVQSVFSTRALHFLAGMLAAGHSESVRPRHSLDPDAAPLRRPLVKTEVGQIDAGGNFRPLPAAGGAGGPGGAVRIVFRGRPGA